jgi:hypothetical protein
MTPLQILWLNVAIDFVIAAAGTLVGSGAEQWSGGKGTGLPSATAWLAAALMGCLQAGKELRQRLNALAPAVPGGGS